MRQQSEIHSLRASAEAILKAVADLQRSPWRWFHAALLGILGSKLVVIGFWGSPAPYYDQWMGEAERLYSPYMNGTLRFADLLGPYSEHRILVARIYNLVLLELAGSWNPVLQMFVSACIHVAFIAGFTYYVRRSTIEILPVTYSMLCALVFLIPFDWGNTLWGFQSEFNFLLITGVASVAILVAAPALGWQWWCGAALSVLSFLCLASGALSPIAASALLAVQLAAGVRSRNPREIAAPILLLCLGAVLVHFTPAGAGPAKGIVVFVHAMIPPSGWPVFLSILSPFIVNAPIAFLTFKLFRDRTRRTDARWRLVAAELWFAAQMAAMAFGRPEDSAPSRYIDIIAMSVLINSAALAELTRAEARSANRLPVALWFGIVGLFLPISAERYLTRSNLLDSAVKTARAETLTKFVHTHDLRLLTDPALVMPNNDAMHWASVILRPEVLGLLPDTFGAPQRLKQSVRHRLLLRGSIQLQPEQVARRSWQLGILLLGLSVGLVLFMAMLPAERPTTMPSP